MTAQQHQGHVDALVARRQALRAAGAPRKVIEDNRVAIVGAITAFNRSLIASHLRTA